MKKWKFLGYHPKQSLVRYHSLGLLIRLGLGLLGLGLGIIHYGIGLGGVRGRYDIICEVCAGLGLGLGLGLGFEFG